jgi:hypothetical protein
MRCFRAWPEDCRIVSPHIHAYRLLSALNLSHASFSVAKTAALIIFCSTVADCEIYDCVSLCSKMISEMQRTLSGCTLAMAFM